MNIDWEDIKARDPRDWQLGTYHTAKRSHGPKPVSKSPGTRKSKSDDNWSAEFDAADDELPMR